MQKNTKDVRKKLVTAQNLLLIVLVVIGFALSLAVVLLNLSHSTAG
ncbi:MAG: hypothetical protein IZT57_01145 [Chloroflexi bacterium]|nr:hypothetical protein [Chloroflexota bacterium]